MAKTREIRKRISSVRNIHKITHTMERVAQSKVMKLNARMTDAQAFRADLARSPSRGARSGARHLCCTGGRSRQTR